MSNEIFPSFPGKEFPSTRAPVWKTQVKTTPSDREYRSTDISFPRYRFKWSYEFLRKKQSYVEYPELEGFFNRHKGRMDDFLLTDPDDNYIANQVFALGDGVTTKFALVRNFGNYVMPIGRPMSTGGTTGQTDIRLDNWGGSDIRVRLGSYANHFAQSGGLNGSSWTRSGVTTATNALAAPNGVAASAEQFTCDSVPGIAHMMASQMVTTIPVGGSICVSAYVKKMAGNDWVLLRVANSDQSAYVPFLFNLATGVEGAPRSPVGSCTKNGSGIYPADDGWYRIFGSVNFSESVGAYGGRFYMVPSDTNSSVWDGDGVTSFGLWGVQCESTTLADPAILIDTPGTVLVTKTIATINDFGTVEFTTPPPVGDTYFWHGYYYWRVRFEKDEMDYNKFMQGFWSAKGVEMITVKAAT